MNGLNEGINIFCLLLAITAAVVPLAVWNSPSTAMSWGDRLMRRGRALEAGREAFRVAYEAAYESDVKIKLQEIQEEA